MLASRAEAMFRDTFAGQNDPEQMDLYCRSTFSPELQRNELADPSRQVLLMEAEGDVVAYASLFLDKHPHTLILSARKPVEIERFYVDHAHHGAGIATELMKAVLEQAKTMGSDTAWLGVWKDNARAIAFYEKKGFRVIGEQPFKLGTEEQTDLVMARAVK